MKLRTQPNFEIRDPCSVQLSISPELQIALSRSYLCTLGPKVGIIYILGGLGYLWASAVVLSIICGAQILYNKRAFTDDIVFNSKSVVEGLAGIARRFYPEAPSTQCLRTLVPKTKNDMSF